MMLGTTMETALNNSSSNTVTPPPLIMPASPASATPINTPVASPLIIHITADDFSSADSGNNSSSSAGSTTGAVNLISDPFMGNKSAHNSAIEFITHNDSSTRQSDSLITHFNSSVVGMNSSKRLLSLGSCDSSSSSLEIAREDSFHDHLDASQLAAGLLQESKTMDRSHVSVVSVDAAPAMANPPSVHSFSQLEDESENMENKDLLAPQPSDEKPTSCDSPYTSVVTLPPSPSKSDIVHVSHKSMVYSESAPFLRPAASEDSSLPYEKRYKSSSEIRPLNLTPCTSDMSVTSSLANGKSVKSLNAIMASPSKSTGSPGSGKWFSSISRMNARLMSINRGSKGKKNLGEQFDKKCKSDMALLPPPAPVFALPVRAQSSTACCHNDDSSFDHEDCHSLDCSELSRLATSDLRTLEEEQRTPLGESVSDNEGDKENNEVEGKKNANAHNGYFTIDSRRMTCRHTKRRTHSIRDKKLLYGIKQFNVEPKKGLQVLENSGFINGDTKSVAQFLFREGRLSKKAIGKYIGGHEMINMEVLDAFVRCHEFTHLILVQALRQFLWSFRLPGEAMQIDRIMEAFAARYCEQNPMLFVSTDTAYLMSFAIIMLNTALHNPNSRTKITVEQFVKQNREINGGGDIPRDILELIYRSIKEEPFKIPNETYDDLMYTFFSPEKEGWLMKQGGSWKNWKRRWFVLSDRCLYYFQHTGENVPKGIIPLENVKVRPLENIDGRSNCFEVYSESNNVVKGCKTDSKGTVVQGNHKSYRMSASSTEERLYWIQCIQDSIREHPFHDIILAKKAALRSKQQEMRAHHTSHLMNNANVTASSKSLPATPKKNHPLTPKRPLAQSVVHQKVSAATPPVVRHHRLFKGAMMTSTPIKKTATPTVNNNATPAVAPEKQENNDTIVSTIDDKLI